jgi:peptidoglycan hydrolase-like protein with peptidoglycan-binding domain
MIDERMFDPDRSLVGAVLSRVATALRRMGSAAWRTVYRRPWDSIGAAVAIAAAATIFVNAVFLQARPHPAPILPGKPRPVVEATGSVIAVEPRPRPGTRENLSETPAVVRTRAQIVSDLQRELARRGFFDGPVDGIYGAKTDAAIRDFEQAAGLKGGSQPDEALLRTIMRSPASAPSALPAAGARPAAKSAAPSKRILAVQRALADFGYGPVRPTGALGPETKAAIERFERDRKLPLTGQISDRLTRELAAVTGRPLE